MGYSLQGAAKQKEGASTPIATPSSRYIND
jgi:hypothetical protein